MRFFWSLLISGKDLTTVHNFNTSSCNFWMLTLPDTLSPLAISSTYASSLRTFSRTTSEYLISPLSVTTVRGAVGKVTVVNDEQILGRMEFKTHHLCTLVACQ